MTKQEKFGPISFNYLLTLIALTFAIAVSIPLVLSAAAQEPDGQSPGTAWTLDAEVNKGALAPGEQHWFVFTPGQNVTEKSLRLVVISEQENGIEFVSLSTYDDSQTSLFDAGDISQMTVFGSGQVITQDNNPDTGERFWVGPVTASESYYVLLNNESDFTVDYWLYSDDVATAAPETTEEPTEPLDAVSDESPAAADNDTLGLPELGTVWNPAPLLDGLNRGKLPANTTYWYTFRKVDFSSNKTLHELDITMFATPDDGHRRHRINFELFPYKAYDQWRKGEIAELDNFGAGMQVSRDGDYNTAERIWRGVVLDNDTYLVGVENGTDVEIDYWFYNGDDVYNPLLGEVPAPEPAQVFAEGASPQTAVPLKLGLNKSGLAPGEEAWYSFRITDFDNEDFEEMALTMITTPDDGNRIRHMVFDVFTAGGVTNWSPGDNTQITNVGAGSVVYRDSNPLTGERFWQGWVVDNDLYLVQVRNGTDVYMDYWLYTGDVFQPELGEKTVSQPITFEPGKAPVAPVELEVGVNDGVLEPGEEQWFTFSRLDAAKGTQVETIFTMVFTPDDGNRVRDVNMQLFEARGLRDWAPDNRFNVDSFGQGSVVSRDGDPTTGELIWKGHLLAGDLYYMRVNNESDVAIDFHIFPDDVINTSLGN